jgi:tetratricopeptide (TPR) repeat protein
MTESPPPIEAAPTKKQFLQTQEPLLSLMDTDPPAAIVGARSLPGRHPHWQRLRASVLCDAGNAAKDADAVDEAIAIFEELHTAAPEDVQITYDLANAVANRAQLDGPKGPDWFLRTSAARRRARALYGEAAAPSGGSDLRFASQAMTNLGNSLNAGYRWIEAFECYQEALDLFPENGVASGSAAVVLARVGSLALLGNRKHLLGVAARLAHHAETHRKVVAELAGATGVARFAKLASRRGGLAVVQPGPEATDYERFVAEHRLPLSPVLEGLGDDPKRWDDARIESLTESFGVGATVPPIFAMFNVMKADYLVARELLFQGLQGLERVGPAAADTGLYHDTLDYAIYGVSTSRLVLAQRSALDVLDKIGAALNEHFDVGLDSTKMYFHHLWQVGRGQPGWQPKLGEAIKGGNHALIALSEIAADLSDAPRDGSLPPGLLNPEKRARRAGTHRFIVMHDMSMGDSRPSEAIEHVHLAAFQKTVMRTMRLARAALLHFLEVIGHAERARPRDGKLSGVMLVRPHHIIRGEE